MSVVGVSLVVVLYSLSLVALVAVDSSANGGPGDL